MTSEPERILWDETSGEAFAAGPLREDLTVELAVIGGGYTGCSATLEAATLGASVCLLEARTIGHGGSGRNVGLVNAGLWLAPDDIRRAIGEAEAGRLLDALGRAPALVFDLIEKYGIACDPRRNGTLHCAHAPAALKELRNRFEQGTRLGAPLRLLDLEETRARTGSPAFHGAIFDPRAGTLQPKAYCRGLARAARAAGAMICEQSTVLRIWREQDTWHIRTEGGSIRARSLILATNAYHCGAAAPFVPQYVPVHFFQFATAPLASAARQRILPGGEGCWDTARLLTSLRIDSEGRLLVGSIGDLAGVGRNVHPQWARRKLAALFPWLGAADLAQGWTGRIAMTPDHIPKIVRFGPDALACFGYSGRGIGPGTTFGLKAARALLLDEQDCLPLSPVPSHRVRFGRVRAALYELGAAVLHHRSGRN